MNFEYQSKAQDGENSEKPAFHTERKQYGQHNQNRTNRQQGSNNDSRMSGHHHNQSFGYKDGQNQRKYIQTHGQSDRRQSGYYEGNHQRPNRNGYTNRWQYKSNNQHGLTGTENTDQDNHQNNHPPQRFGGNNRAYYNNKPNYNKGNTHHDHHYPNNNIVSSEYGNSELRKNIDSQSTPNDNTFNILNSTNKEKDQITLANDNNTSPNRSNDDFPQSNTSQNFYMPEELTKPIQRPTDNSPQEPKKGETADAYSSETSENQLIDQINNIRISPLNALSDTNTNYGTRCTEQAPNELTSSGQISVATSQAASPETNASSRNGTSAESSYRNSESSATDSAANPQSPSTSVGETTAAKSSTTTTTEEALSAGSRSWKSRIQNINRTDNSTERQAKSLLNKLTIEKFATVIEKLALLEEDIVDEEEMQTFVNLIVSKAALERDWSEMYADLCLVLFWRSPCLKDPKLNSFRMALVTKIENEFLSLPKKLELTNEQKEGLDQASIELELIKMKNHIHGVVTLIGELYQRKILPYKVLNQVVLELVINQDLPDEHFIECFVQLICTTGYFIDQNPASKTVLDLWFGRLIELKNKSIYSKRLVCVIQDVLDLRNSNWVKKIHKYTPSGLDEIKRKFQRETDVGGPNYVAFYGDRKIIGKPINGTTNPLYAAYIAEQRERFQSKKPANPTPTPSSS